MGAASLPMFPSAMVLNLVGVGNKGMDDNGHDEVVFGVGSAAAESLGNESDQVAQGFGAVKNV